MVTSQLSMILKDLETFFECPLETDSNNSCLVDMGIGISLQLELDRHGFLLVGCRLGMVHMGRYRNDLIRAALKSNELTPLSSGILGFSHKSQQLILFIRVDTQAVPLHQLTEQLSLFTAKAKLWKDAIAKGEVPAIASRQVAGKGLFGLIS